MKQQKLKALFMSAFLLISILAFAQAPQKMSYQAVIRNASNVLVTNTTVGMQISILQGSAVGTPVYVETQTPTTNANGLASVQIGGGTVVSGSFATINWATGGPYFIKTETDPLGGIAYTITGTSQMLSTPYALYAEKAGSVATSLGKTYLILSGNVTDAQAATIIANDVGSNTQFVWILNTTALTTVNLSGITNLVEVKITNNTALASVNLNGLSDVVTDLNIQGNSALSSLSFPALNKVGGLLGITTNPILASCSLPALTTTSSNSSNQISSLPMLTSLSLPNLSSIGALRIQSCGINSLSMPALTIANNFKLISLPLITLSLPNLTTALSLDIQSNSSLVSINMPMLNAISGFGSYINQNNALTSISLPVLATIQSYFEIASNPLLAGLSFPALVSCPSTFLVSGNATLSSFSANSLITANDLQLGSCPALTSVSLNSLTGCQNLQIAANPILTSISLPSFTTVNTMVIVNNALLSSISTPILAVVNNYYYAYGCKLPSSQINAILNKFLTVTPTAGKYIVLQSQTPPAPPTGPGIADKATLISNGQFVLTD
jgi:hypothetical protein